MVFSKHQRQTQQHARATFETVLYGMKELVGSALSIAWVLMSGVLVSVWCVRVQLQGASDFSLIGSARMMASSSHLNTSVDVRENRADKLDDRDNQTTESCRALVVAQSDPVRLEKCRGADRRFLRRAVQ
jgi:hypothetical protein